MSKGGTQTAVIATGGKSSPPGMDASFEYDGSSWTSGGTMGTGRYTQGGDGIQTAALAFGGGFPLEGLTEQFNGSTWSTKNVMGSTRYNLAGCGS